MMLQSMFRFPGFLTRACTLSYDDGVRDDIRLVEIMRKYGIKGTFNLNTKNMLRKSERCLSAEECIELYGDDMEVALHGYRHLRLENHPSYLSLRDVIANREHLENTFGKVIRGMAYAYGTYDESVVEMLRMSGIAYSRTTLSTGSFDFPEEWLTLHPTCHHNDPRLFELVDTFLAEPNPSNWKTRVPKLFYLWGHSYEFPRDDNWDVIERFCEIMGNSDNVWKATNIELYNYIKAFYSVNFSLDGKYAENLSSIDVYMNADGKDVIVKAGETVKL